MKKTLTTLLAIIGLTAAYAAEPQITATPQPSSGVTNLKGQEIIPATTTSASDHILAGKEDYVVCNLSVPENTWKIEKVDLVYKASKDGMEVVIVGAKIPKQDIETLKVISMDYHKDRGLTFWLKTGTDEAKPMIVKNMSLCDQLGAHTPRLNADFAVVLDPKVKATSRATASLGSALEGSKPKT